MKRTQIFHDIGRMKKKVKNKKSEENFFYNEGSRLEKIFDNNWWPGKIVWLKKDFRHKLQ